MKRVFNKDVANKLSRYFTPARVDSMLKVIKVKSGGPGAEVLAAIGKVNDFNLTSMLN